MGLSSKIQVSCQIHMMRSGTRAAAKSTALAQLQTRTRLVRSARNLAKVVVVVIRHATQRESYFVSSECTRCFHRFQILSMIARLIVWPSRLPPR